MGDNTAGQKKELSGLVRAGNASGFKSFVSTLLQDDSTQPLAMRPVLLHAAELLREEMALCLSNSPQQHVDEDNLISLLNNVLRAIAANAMKSQFDEADALCRELLFQYHVACGEYKVGAAHLAGVDVDSSLLRLSVDKKADVLVRCAEAFLQEEDSTSAETLLSKARVHMNAVEEAINVNSSSNSSDSSSGSDCFMLLRLRYRVIRARVDDANRKFIEAARQYHELSSVSSTSIPLQEKLELLGDAVTCAVLGKAGPQRSRVLGLLNKDDRLADLAGLPKFSSHASVLEKMYTERLLLQTELVTFESSLKAHQQAQTADGTTIVEKAVIEHNMQAAGRIYDNIAFPQLAQILRLSVEEAEAVAAKMIGEKHLKACIDQTENLLFFEGPVGNSADSTSSADVGSLLSWDSNIWDICTNVTECVDVITSKYPDIVEAAEAK